MTYRPEPVKHELTITALRQVLVEIQRSDLMRVNALRALLGLPPVRAPKGRDRDDEQEGESDDQRN